MEKNELSYNISALGFSGSLLPDGKKSSKFRIFWFFLTFLSFSTTCVLAFTHFSTLDKLTFIEINNLVSMLIGFVQATFRRIYFTRNMKGITLLVKKLTGSRLGSYKKLKTMEENMKINSTKKLRSFSNKIFIFNIIMVLVTIVNPITTIFSERLFIFNFWFPWDMRATPTYHILLTIQIGAVYTSFSTLSTTDAFVCSLMLATSERASLLARAAPQALLPGRGGQMTRQFKAWVKYHQHYLGLVASINKIMGPVILLMYFFSGINITMFAYLSVVSIKNADITNGIVCFILLMIILVQLSSFSYSGQQIQSKSSMLSKSTIGVSQVSRGGLKAGPALSGLCVITARCCGHETEHVSALGFCLVSMETFATIFSASMSYFLVILQMQPRGT